IEALKNLRVLDLGNNKIRNLPEVITRLPNLYRLILRNNPIGDLPRNIGLLQKLRILDIRATGISTLPLSFHNLSGLVEFHWQNKHLKQFPYPILGLDNIRQGRKCLYDFDLSMFLEHSDIVELKKMIVQAGKIQLDFPDRVIAFHAFRNNREQLQNYKPQQLLPPLCLHNQRVSGVIIKQLVTQNKKKSLQEGDIVYLMGLPQKTRRKYIQELELRKIKVSEEFSEELSHVIIGQVLELEEIPQDPHINKVNFLNQGFVEDFIDEAKNLYIKNAVEDDIEYNNIRLLLFDRDLDNVRIALTMLRVGGVPKELYEELFILHIKTKNKGIRRSIRKLLAKFMSESDVQGLLRCSTQRYVEGLEKYMLGSLCFDIFRLHLLFYRNFKQGYNYILNKATEDQQRIFLQEYIKSNILNLKNHRIITDLPNSLRFFPDLHHVILERTGIKNIPEVFLKYDFPKLRQLNLKNSGLYNPNELKHAKEYKAFEKKYPDCEIVLV
ncbi:MAG: hypothetical protein MK212_05650, partial [Saprospiraceae bacterium]|nr:hypothetical protein [Saprospiraceae bacterium]